MRQAEVCQHAVRGRERVLEQTIRKGILGGGIWAETRKLRKHTMGVGVNSGKEQTQISSVSTEFKNTKALPAFSHHPETVMRRPSHGDEHKQCAFLPGSNRKLRALLAASV